MALVADLRQLWTLPRFRKLFRVRLLSQSADGMVQVGLASLLFFSPQSMGTARGVALGFAVILLPFTVIGPFAGVLLDRWRRRNVLVYGNLIRAMVCLGMAASLGLLSGVGLVSVLGLIALSINRFLLAALSAGLPTALAADAPGSEHDLLMTANSIVPTLGTVSAFVGAGVGFLLGLLLPNTQAQEVAALVCAAVLMLAASYSATRLGSNELGPEQLARTPLRAAVRIVTTDLHAGARYLAARVTPGQGLLAMASHRFLYGVVFVSGILIARNLLATPGDMAAGMANFGVILALTAVGFGLSVLITPVASRRTGAQTWVGLTLLLAAASQLLLATRPERWIVYLSTVLLGLSAQGGKIAVDTIVQRDTADNYRGRAFAFYDVLFNGAFVAAAVLAAVTVPDSGWSRPLYLGLAGGYLLVGLLMLFRAARIPREVALLPPTP